GGARRAARSRREVTDNRDGLPHRALNLEKSRVGSAQGWGVSDHPVHLHERMEIGLIRPIPAGSWTPYRDDLPRDKPLKSFESQQWHEPRISARPLGGRPNEALRDRQACTR